MKQKTIILLWLLLLCLYATGQKNADSAILRLDNYRILEIDGKQISNPSTGLHRKLVISDGQHKALIEFNISSYFQFEDFRVFGTGPHVKTLEFTTEKGKEYVISGVVLNTVDDKQKIVTINDCRYAEVIERKTKTKVGGIVESGIQYFEAITDASNYTHLYFGNVLPDNELSSLHNIGADADKKCIIGETNDGYKVCYFFYGDKQSTKITDFKLKPGNYNLLFQWGFYGITPEIRGASYCFKTTAGQTIFEGPKDLISNSGSLISLGFSELNDIFFLQDGIHGWIAGKNGILLRTNDGGENWKYDDVKMYKLGSFFTEMAKNYSNSNLSCSFNSIFFVDSTDGWIGGENGLLLHTMNGGTDWSVQNIGNKLHIRQIYFKNKEEGIISEQNIRGIPVIGGIMYSKDSGDSWEYIDKSSAHFPTHYIINLESIWKNEFNALACTVDKGNTWQVRMGASKAFNLTTFKAFTALDENNLWVIQNELLYFSADKGNHWEPKSSQKVNFKKMFFTNMDNGYAIGAGGNLLKTTDGGSTWQNINLNTLEFINDIYFDQHTGWALGKLGGIFKTEDGGLSWNHRHILDFVK